ncbi:hypothetical protein Q4E93_24925 [Flavitalea sp. BT771]|nr:hypothetical protein [Flavitalea sp. BT771]MDO6433874.1 hypothetical protein [Flavitalea sp. BT771]MDV6222221.1 hypothetical protein [Flavitalea sp. BT771]
MKLQPGDATIARFFQGKKTVDVAGLPGISPITVQSQKTNALLN